MTLFRIHYSVRLPDGTVLNGHLDRQTTSPAQAQAQAIRTLGASYSSPAIIRKVKRVRESAHA